MPVIELPRELTEREQWTLVDFVECWQRFGPQPWAVLAPLVPIGCLTSLKQLGLTDTRAGSLSSPDWAPTPLGLAVYDTLRADRR